MQKAGARDLAERLLLFYLFLLPLVHLRSRRDIVIDHQEIQHLLAVILVVNARSIMHRQGE